MSGFAFQKLNGNSTTAFKQLEELTEIKNLTDDLLETSNHILDASLKPDVWRQAKMLFPDNELLPIYWQWQAQTTSDKANRVYNDGKKYFGTLSIALNIDNPRKKEGTHKANLILSNDGKEIMSFENGYKGRHDWNIETGFFHYTGLFDQLTLRKWHSHKYMALVGVSFIGFEVGESIEYVPPEIGEDDNDIIAVVENMPDGALELIGYLDNNPSIESYYEVLDINGIQTLENDEITLISHVTHPFVIYLNNKDSEPIYSTQIQVGSNTIHEIVLDTKLNENIFIDFVLPAKKILSRQFTLLSTNHDFINDNPYVMLKLYNNDDVHIDNRYIYFDIINNISFPEGTSKITIHDNFSARYEHEYEIIEYRNNYNKTIVQEGNDIINSLYVSTGIEILIKEK